MLGHAGNVDCQGMVGLLVEGFRAHSACGLFLAFGSKACDGIDRLMRILSIIVSIAVPCLGYLLRP